MCTVSLHRNLSLWRVIPNASRISKADSMNKEKNIKVIKFITFYKFLITGEVVKEMVLTHLFDDYAIIALVDYSAYTASVKKLPVNDDTKLQLEELRQAGALRVYRKDLDTNYDAWLAVDRDRGCLAVTKGGDVRCESTVVYVRSLLSISFHISRETYAPYRFGMSSESFCQTARAVEDKYQATLLDTRVRDEITRLTGVGFMCSGDDALLGCVSLRLLLFGQDVDRLEVRSSGKELSVAISAGHVEELLVENKGTVLLVEAGGTFSKVYVGARVTELKFHGTFHSYPELIPACADCSLGILRGYSRPEADLSAFRDLQTFDSCWVMPSRNGPLLKLKLPRSNFTVMRHCFTNARFQEMLPYLSHDGVLNLMGFAEIKDSFLWFSGVTSICGVVAGAVVDSFLSDYYTGSFDVTVSAMKASFASFGTVKNSEDVEAAAQRVGKITTVLGHDSLRMLGEQDGKYHVGDMTLDSRKQKLFPWKNVHRIVSTEWNKVAELHLTLNRTTTYELCVNVQKCWIYEDYLSRCIEPVFKGAVVDILKSGPTFYPNVLEYGEYCFKGKEFAPTHVGVIPEGVTAIGDRAFYQASGISYLVIPRSCKSIGVAAFAEMKSAVGLTTICVYKDSYGHQWSKGKKINTLVIESLEDIPKLAPRETENDFLAAFVDTPAWAVKSKAYVAKLLTMSEINLADRISVVTTLSNEVEAFFDKQYALLVKNKARCVEFTNGDAGCPEGYISRAAVQAAALNALCGSYIDLLDVSVLQRYVWTVRQAYDVKRWVGKPKIAISTKPLDIITIYVRGKEVLYVGCGSVQEVFSAAYRWAVPKEVLASEWLFGPDVVGRLWLNGQVHEDSGVFSCKVHDEWLKDVAESRLRAYAQSALVWVDSVEPMKSGRVRMDTLLMFDIVTGKLYKFVSRDRLTSLGFYSGEMSIDEYRRLRDFTSKEKACLQSVAFQYVKSEPAAPSFELEFCRTHPEFQLFGRKPRTDLFMELLLNSGLVRHSTYSAVRNRLSDTCKNHMLADGTNIVAGRTANHTYLLGIVYNGKSYGFEAGFDMLKFAQEADEKIVRGASYPNPNGGYLTVVKQQDLFSVTPVPPVYSVVGEDSQQMKAPRSCVFLALDFTSGKLVIAFDLGVAYKYASGVICSFNSAKDARDMYTELGCKFLSVPSQEYTEKWTDAVEVHQTDGVYHLAIYGGSRWANSLLALKEFPLVDDNIRTEEADRVGYDETILKYCRT